MSKHHALLVTAALALAPTRSDAAGCPVPGFSYAAFGDTSVSVGNGNTDSWDSQAGAYASSKCSGATCSGGVATNGTSSGSLSLGPNGDINGQCTIGAGAATSNISGSSNCDSTGALGAALSLPVPTLPSSGVTSLGTISGDTNIASAGSYSATSISLSGHGTLTVGAGPVVIYLTGSGSVLSLSGNAEMNNNTQIPSNLVFMCTSSSEQTISVVGNGNAYYGIYCPKADITISGNGTIYGAVVGKSVSFNGNNGYVHYDKALGSLASTALTCGSSEVSRATPIVTTLSSNPYVVQGTYEASTAAAKTITTTTDVATWEFPYLIGHMRARLASTVTTTASSFSAGTILFDTGSNGIPTVTTSGCALGTNSNFTSSCRNVFTNTNSTPSTGVTTFSGTPTSRVKMFNDTNASTIGALIAPTGTGANQVPNIGATEWQTIVRRVLKGQSNGTVAKLGGVDRSTVAVINASTLAGVSTRPTMVYFGGTDGMLHAACASTGGTTASASSICPSTLVGTELWAFVPRVQLPLIRTNKQRIDGSVRVIDAFGLWPDPTTGTTQTTKTWRTILTFQTGFSDSSLGGKPGVYALDVTDPAKPILLWEYTTPTTTGAQLGVGLVTHSGPSLISGAPTNLAVVQTNNGGTGGAGVVVNALSLETGAQKWSTPFSYIYAGPRPSTQTYDGAIPATGIPGGAVGVDLLGAGFTTDIVMGDLYGDLWRLNASTGANTTASSKPLFSFSTDKHPIGGLPAILDNGNKIAVFGSGAYTDPTGAAQWSTTGQRVVGVKLSGTTSLTESSTLPFNIALSNTGEKINSQVTVVGTEVFVTTDSSTDINATAYGTTSSTTGHAYKLDTTASTPALTVVSTLQGGASAVTFNSATTTLVGGAADKTQQLAGTATTSGTSVDYYGNKKTTRRVWLKTSL